MLADNHCNGQTLLVKYHASGCVFFRQVDVSPQFSPQIHPVDSGPMSKVITKDSLVPVWTAGERQCQTESYATHCIAALGPSTCEKDLLGQNEEHDSTC